MRFDLIEPVFSESRSQIAASESSPQVGTPLNFSNVIQAQNNLLGLLF